MLVKEVMNKEVKTISGESTIKNAAVAMNQFGIGSLIVVKDSRLLGIITERDILEKIVALGKNASSIKVKSIMTKEVVMVEPDMDVHDAAELMHKNKIKKLPVVSRNKVIGIVTAYDLCAIEPKFVEKLSKLFLFPKEKRYIAG